MMTNLNLKRIATALAGAAILVASACLQDVRPPELRGGIDSARATRGARALEATTNRLGGLDRWRKLGDAEAGLTIRFHSRFWEWVANIWPRLPQSTRFYWVTGRDDVRADLLEAGRVSETWGVQNWVAYSGAPGEPLRFEKNEQVNFLLPTIKFFLSAPFLLSKGEILADAGEENIHGRLYRRIFVTWTGAAPRPDFDQYLIYVNARTGLVDYLHFTVREKNPFAYCTTVLENYREVNGVRFPTLIKNHFQTAVRAASPDNLSFSIEVDSLRFGRPRTASFYVPNPGLRAAKQD